MCARTTAKSEKELSGTKEEDEPRRQLADAVRMQPRVGFHTADITEDLRTERQEPEPPHIKEEVEDKEVHHIKEEEEPILIKKGEGDARPHIKQEVEEDITKFPSTGVPLKSEAEGQSEESRGAEPPSSSSSQHMKTEGDGDHCGGSPADGLLAALSDCDDMTSHPPHTDDDDDDKQYEGVATARHPFP
ncbi:uncharacterized protein LOC133473662 isoform X2 [Phyllopteryx taeniolatus]|uniref:uncharacterized protein LOC133473662 isoform X2 n=1 Tax=Phyllopteryx taeniolatus TaxID=161469 RepID=UPI002AD58381|nr:uncharacterized protein LOC133473662 isoform X2 [Phyllopteryx taeniolatus]